METIRKIKPLNCWETPCGQSAAKLEREGSTTIRKEYVQANGSSGPLTSDVEGEDIVCSTWQHVAGRCPGAYLANMCEQTGFNITGFTSRDFIPAGSPVTSGAFATPFLGFDIDWTTEASANVATFFHPSFLTLAVQQDMDVRVYDLGLEGKRGQRINCDLLFGLKQLDDTRVVTIS